MSNLPAAVRVKDGQSLVWFSNEEEEDVPEFGRNRRIGIESKPYIPTEPQAGEFNAWVSFVSDVYGAKSLRLDHLDPIIEPAEREQRTVIELIKSRLTKASAEKSGQTAAESLRVQSSFAASEELVRKVLTSQADGQLRSFTTSADFARSMVEVSERIEEAIADIGYRWAERNQVDGRIAVFSSSSQLEWCDQELSKLLVFELNISIFAASNVFSSIFPEIRDHLTRAQLQGDWGSLHVDGNAILLAPSRGAASNSR